jgi:hypothetical protein
MELNFLNIIIRKGFTLQKKNKFEVICDYILVYQRRRSVFCEVQTEFLNVRFEVFTAVTMKNAVFWDVAPFRSYMNRRFGGTYRLHLQGRKIRERGTSVSRWLQNF